MKTKVVFSSLKQNWKTPQETYGSLDNEFKFDFDPCPADPSFDGLQIEWGQRNFVNPPFKTIGQWIKKGVEEWQKGKLVVFLIPSRTDTKWWHEYIMKADEIRFLERRLKYSEYKTNAPFPSCVVVFNPRQTYDI